MLVREKSISQHLPVPGIIPEVPSFGFAQHISIVLGKRNFSASFRIGGHDNVRKINRKTLCSSPQCSDLAMLAATQDGFVPSKLNSQ